MRQTRLKIAGAGAASIALVLLGQPASSTASVPIANGKPGHYRLTTSQQSTVDQIMQLGTRRYRGQFGRIELDQKTGKLLLRWSGKVPAEVNRIAGANGTTIEIAPSALTDSAVLSEEERLMAAYPKLLVGAQPSLDFTSIQLDLADGVSVDQAKGSIASTLPLSFATGIHHIELSGRWADTQPFYGGGAISGSGLGPCSTGFVFKKSTHTYEVTANHCNHGTFKTPTGLTVGSTIGYSSKYDAQYLGTDKYGNYVFNGGWKSTSSILQNGSGNTVVGQIVCTSGAHSGKVCDVYVQSNNVIYGSEGPFFQGRQQDGLGAVTGGDSGGPVYYPRPDGTAYVVGMIEGTPGRSTDEGQCQGDTSGLCYQTVDFTGAGNILVAFGGSPL